MAHPQLHTPVTGPMVWKRADLEQDQSWLIHLTESQLAELHNAVLAVRDRDVFTFEASDFPLPEMADFFSMLRHEVHHGRGVLLLRGLDVENYTIDELYKLYWGFNLHLGTPMCQNARGELIGEVTDRGNDYTKNNVRGYTTQQAIAFHCDSGDVVNLLCVHPSRTGGQSRIVCSAAIYNEMLANHRELLDPLYEGFHFDLRGEGATGDRNETSNYRVPVYHYHENRFSMRFNRKTISDGMRKAGLPLDDLQQRAVDCVKEISERPDFQFDMDFRKGDIQMLSNHDVLHARTEFEDWPEPERKRRLLRAWVNLPEPRPMRVDFTDRFNTGPRNGPAVQKGVDYWVGA